MGINLKLAIATATYLITSSFISCTSPKPPFIIRSDIRGTLTQEAVEHESNARAFEQKSLDELIELYSAAKDFRDWTFYEIKSRGIEYQQVAGQEEIEAAYSETMKRMRMEFPDRHRLVVSILKPNQPGTGHNYYEDGTSIITVWNRYNLFQLQGALAHETSHAQDIGDETDAQILAWEVLAGRALNGDLLSKASLADQLVETLSQYIYKKAYDEYALDKWYAVINNGKLFGDEKRKVAHVEGDVFERYQRKPLLAEMAAANGEMTHYTAAYTVEKGKTVLYLDAIKDYLGRELRYFQQTRKSVESLVAKGNDLRERGRFTEAEQAFRAAAKESAQLKEGILFYRQTYNDSMLYVADAHARRGELLEAKVIVEDTGTDTTPKGVNSFLLSPSYIMSNSLERDYLDEFRRDYTFREALDDYLLLRKLREQAEKELIQQGIDPNREVTDQETIDDTLKKIFPYSSKKFPSNETPTISFMKEEEYSDMKAQKQAIGRRLRIVVGKTEQGWEIKVNPSIPLHDLIEAVSYAAGYTKIGADKKYDVQLFSLETLANMALDGDALAKYRLLYELERSAMEYSLTKSGPRADMWITATGKSMEEANTMKSAIYGDFIDTYEIKPFLSAMRMLKGDTAGGYKFGLLELDGLHKFMNFQ